LASANPVYGCYNKSKSFRENTKISNAILSRFDLIFLLLDKPDPDHDKKLSEHIMKVFPLLSRYTIKRENEPLRNKPILTHRNKTLPSSYPCDKSTTSYPSDTQPGTKSGRSRNTCVTLETKFIPYCPDRPVR